jgi:hypothetical protein
MFSSKAEFAFQFPQTCSFAKIVFKACSSSSYQLLAEKFPQGLADIKPLPEEFSGEVGKVAQK